jgi:hypothetical protein
LFVDLILAAAVFCVGDICIGFRRSVSISPFPCPLRLIALRHHVLFGRTEFFHPDHIACDFAAALVFF